MTEEERAAFDAIAKRVLDEDPHFGRIEHTHTHRFSWGVYAAAVLIVAAAVAAIMLIPVR